MILGSWFLNEIWITDLSSAPVGILMHSSKLFLFFEQNSFKLSCETVIGIVLCYSHQVCCLLCYLCEITSLLNFYPSVSGCGCNGFGEEKVRIGGFAYHYSSSPLIILIGKKHIRSWSSTMSSSTVRNLHIS